MEPVTIYNSFSMLLVLLLSLISVTVTVGSVLTGNNLENNLINLIPTGSDLNLGKTVRSFPWDRKLFTLPSESPVDIITSRVKHIKFPHLFVVYRNNPKMAVEMKNTGHGVELTVPNADDRPILRGGALPGDYIFENLHFHWGKTSNFGSEHFLDGESFSMEAHLVTFKKEYGTFNDAKKKTDGIVVLTFFAHISNEDNPLMSSMLSFIPRLEERQAVVQVTGSEKLLWFLEAVQKNQGYYAYPGSLTTKPYSETVTFFIMPVPIDISNSQLEMLRTLKDCEGKKVTTNRRELQPIFKRTIFYASGISATTVN